MLRIDLQIEDVTPDDLKIRWFLALIERQGLSWQACVKRAIVLGFAQLEEEIDNSGPVSLAGGSPAGGRPAGNRPTDGMVMADSLSGGQRRTVRRRSPAERHNPGKSLNTRKPPGTGKRRGPIDQPGFGDQATGKAMVPDHHETFDLPVQTCPLPSVSVSQHSAIVTLQPSPSLQPQAQPRAVKTSFEYRISEMLVKPVVVAAPEGSGNVKTTLPGAVLRTAVPQTAVTPGAALQAAVQPEAALQGRSPPPSAAQPSAAQPSTAPRAVVPQGTGLLTEEEMRFSPTAVEQARKLMGSFGKGYDG
ncbi:hypothetical protein LDB30_06645 [Acidithiobacillus ferrooxidans]|nr:hypothetical protein LDB30_06645 [Acidithiobacillus ferrooxidans]